MQIGSGYNANIICEQLYTYIAIDINGIFINVESLLVRHFCPFLSLSIQTNIYYWENCADFHYENYDFDFVCSPAENVAKEFTIKFSITWVGYDNLFYS